MSGIHVPLAQVPLQQDAFVEHASLSEMQLPTVVVVVVLTGVVVVVVGPPPVMANGAQSILGADGCTVWVPN